MRKILTALSFVAMLPAGAALAEDDHCSVPRSQWQPREAAMQLAEDSGWIVRSEEHTSELQSLMRSSYAVFCLKKKNITLHKQIITQLLLVLSLHTRTDS